MEDPGAVLVRLVLCALAVWQVVEVARHASFWPLPEIRSWLEASGRLPALLCGWCLSVWVGWAVWSSLTYGGEIALVVVGGLGASRLANVLSDLTHDRCRTPKASKVEVKTPPPDEPEPGVSDEQVDAAYEAALADAERPDLR